MSNYYFGADLSYVNQILDHAGVYKDSGVVESPYKTFAQYGTRLARFRLWHHPVWTQTVYGNSEGLMYNAGEDVEKSIGFSKQNGMEVMLDFHYSDTWADPGKQTVPEAWKGIVSLDILSDSVYNYTYKTLFSLYQKGLMPEFVQIGNETNCGMLYSDASADFPKLNVCDGNWDNLALIMNRAIKAVRDIDEIAGKQTKILLHIADPKHVEWWMDNMVSSGKITDFNIIGISYYPIWHTSVLLGNLAEKLKGIRLKYNKDVMIVETAYPWTTDWADNYDNLFGGNGALSSYPVSESGQLNLMIDLNKQVLEAGGIGVIYWEPAWITSEMKTLWGTGSAWENCAFYDLQGNTNKTFDYMKYEY